LAVATFGLLTSLAGCSDPGVVRVQADLRQAPASESKVLAVIPKGSAIQVGDCSNGWCRVSWNGRGGYILTKSMRLAGGARGNMTEPGQADEDADPAMPDEVLAAPSSLN
jgi:uncharacterized protein YraI